MKHRDVDEILIDVSTTSDLQTLINLWNEIADNKKKYSLTDIWLANRKISEISLQSNGTDIDKGKFYLHLTSQLKHSYQTKADEPKE